MSYFPRPAFAAVLSLLGFAAIAGVTGGAKLVASDIPDQLDTGLLPQSVIDAAVSEQQAIPDTLELPQVAAPAASLALLVATHDGAAPLDPEQHCLAAAVYFEAKGEPLAGQLAVAQVILNRARSGRFASSLCGVVLQPSQFSFVRKGRLPSVSPQSRGWREAVAIAQIARDELWQGEAPRALYFHARRVSPGWNMQRVAAIGNHIFYR